MLLLARYWPMEESGESLNAVVMNALANPTNHRLAEHCALALDIHIWIR